LRWKKAWKTRYKMPSHEIMWPYFFLPFSNFWLDPYLRQLWRCLGFALWRAKEEWFDKVDVTLWKWSGTTDRQTDRCSRFLHCGTVYWFDDRSLKGTEISCHGGWLIAEMR
jgi:hypothetical protein